MAGLIVDLVNDGLIAQGISTLATGTTQGVSNDGLNGEESLNMLVAVGPVTGVISTINVCAEESTDGTTYTQIPGMVLTVTVTTALANVQQATRGLRSNRYYRANLKTFTSTTTVSVPASVTFISQKKMQPAAATGADKYPTT